MILDEHLIEEEVEKAWGDEFLAGFFEKHWELLKGRYAQQY